MKLQTCLTTLIILLRIDISSGCDQRNISCKDIKTADGFTFLHGCPKGSDIEVTVNGIKVAYAHRGNQTTQSLNGTIIGNHSVDTRDCRDLRVYCVVYFGESGVKDICLDFTVTGEAMRETPTPTPTPTPMPTPTPTPTSTSTSTLTLTQRNHIIVWSVCVPFGLMLIGGLCYICWKKKQHVASTVSGILRYLRCSCLRNEVAQAGMEETQQTTNPEGSDLDTTRHNGAIRLSEISATDPCEGGENIEQDNTLESVHVHSIDPTADGKPPQPFSLDRNSSNQGIQPAERGDVIVSDGNTASNRRAVSSLRDDPGGEKDNNERAVDGIGEVPSRWTVGDRAPEDHGNEGQPLLLNQRADNQDFDMTGKAVALVDERGFDSDQASRYSPVPDADVESTPNMKN